jgi:hypothetical protein
MLHWLRRTEFTSGRCAGSGRMNHASSTVRERGCGKVEFAGPPRPVQCFFAPVFLHVWVDELEYLVTLQSIMAPRTRDLVAYPSIWYNASRIRGQTYVTCSMRKQTAISVKEGEKGVSMRELVRKRRPYVEKMRNRTPKSNEVHKNSAWINPISYHLHTSSVEG